MKYCFVIAGLAAMTNAHMASWNKGMYCKGGPNPTVDDPNTNTAVTPLFNLTYDEWFQQRVTGCNLAPPPDGEFLELPAGKSFMTELADNRAVTTLSYGGKLATEWGDGKNRTIPWRGPGNPAGCLADNPDGAGGNLHTTSIEDAAGTAWAISYEEFDNVNLTNLVVFSVLYHTPFFREAWYDVPADLPACPEAGCYCAWLWVPNGCGQPNMYMQSHRCNVTGAATNPPKKLAKPSPPEWCADDLSKCVTGAKQMIAWNQAEQNNVQVPNGMSPGYNYRMGFQEGAQKDIFED